MKVLLTGGRGMVGRNVREAAGAAAHEVLAPGRDELNLFDGAAVDAYLARHKPDLIIHAAGRVGGIAANIKNPVAFLVENLDIGRNVILGAARAGVPRLINLSSSCMYPRDAENPLREAQVLTGTLEPTNEGYAIAKIAAMKLCRYITTENPALAYKTLIPCNIYGRHDHFDLERGHLVAAVITKLDQARRDGAAEIDIWGAGTARREFMYAGDLADAIWRAAESYDGLPEVMNVGVGDDHSVNDYYQTIAEVVGFTGRFTHDLTKPAGMARKLMDVSGMKAWGYTPATSLKEGLAQTYRYYLDEVLQAA